MINKINSKKEKSRNTHWLEIKKTLRLCSENDLMGLIAELYSLSKSNKDFLDARFIQDGKILGHYKIQIKKYLAPNEPWKESQQISLKDAKKILSTYKKATSNPVGLIELMVHYVECGTDFLCEYGDMYEQYYVSLESVFDSALKLMSSFSVSEIQEFIDRLKIVVKKSCSIGWGHYDSVLDMLNTAYPENQK